MINFKSVSLHRGRKVLFKEASFTVHNGEKVGITGANGAGKSSLFGLVLGHLQTETGDVSMPPGMDIAHVAQETPGVATPAIEYVIDGDVELRAVQKALSEAEISGDGTLLAHLYAQLETIGGYDAEARAARLMDGLSFIPSEIRRPVSEFSGGWRMRLNLAQALMCRSDMLLLDEPTNHLDLDAVLWLQDWLSRYPGTLLLISHDRDFLDDVVDHILHIEHQSVSLHTGNYSAFEVRRAEALSQQQSAFEAQQRDLARIQSFVDRFRAQATKARQVQSRLKALDRMALIAQAQADSPFRFSFLQPVKLPSPLLKLDEGRVGYEDRPLLTHLRFTLNPGDRIGLLGANGAGKSSLIKMLAGALPLLDGERLEAQDLRIGYFAQHQLEQLNPDWNALQHIQKLNPAAEERDLRNFIGGFGFSGERALEPVAPFSGGEKARLALALLIYRKPNLLLLDEPTNHLDLNARDALSMALQDYPGALVVVSHDRHLLRSVADDLWLVADGRVEPFDGDLNDYARWLSGRRGAAARPGAVAASPKERKLDRKATAERRKQLKPLQTVVDKAEALMEKLTTERKNLEARLAEPGLYADEPAAKTRLARLMEEQTKVDEALATAESNWLEATAALELALQ
ncbi:MAG: ATP-binding cassette domain-containing protein [Methylococcaceae bacterium]